MKCEICHKGPLEMVTIYRTNPKGVTGIWRCWKHLTSEQRAGVHPEDQRIVDILEEDNRRKDKP